MKAPTTLTIIMSAALVLGPAAAVEAGIGPSSLSGEDGEALFLRYCSSCHGKTGRGDGPNAPFLGDSPPRDLTDPVYLGKLSDERLFKVIAEGGRSVELSNFMPPFRHTLDRERISRLVAFVRKLSLERRKIGEPMPEEIGARLVVELGCPNCHKIGNLPPRPVAPPLDDAGGKFRAAWLTEFLRAPRRIRPVGYVPLSLSRMPDFRLSPEEATALTAHLLSRRRELGKAAVPGPGASRAGENSFLLLLRYGCRACHKFGDNEAVAGPDLEEAKRRLRGEWMARFILDLGRVDPAVPMPRIVLEPEHAREIASFLAGEDARGRGAARLALIQRGGALYRDLGCGGCHGRPGPARRPAGPPDLTDLGDKVRRTWLRSFLRNPQPMRPWLKIRMPDFRLSEKEAETITQYFTRVRRNPKVAEILPTVGGEEPGRPARAKRGKALFALYECAKCHPAPNTAPKPERDADSLAPSLRDAGRRLKPAWVLRFLRDPQAVYPGTKMPNFFYDSGEAIEEEAEEKMLSLRDYLMTLGR